MSQEVLTPDLQEKYSNLRGIISGYPDLLVAYSGGVDSTLLLKVAVDVLKDRALGIIGVSPSLATSELEGAIGTARKFGLPYHLVKTHEMQDENYASNPPDRCYFCKKELFTEMFDYAAENGYRIIADGTNLDDVGDYRPGQQAAHELQVVSPLKEAGLTKQAIREISRYLNLPTWNKPELACLASRLPAGTRLTEEALRRVEQAEQFLKSKGFRIVRVRHHEELARIEVSPHEIARFMNTELREQVFERFKAIGYQFITLDLQGYRQGSLNQLHQTPHCAGSDRHYE